MRVCIKDEEMERCFIASLLERKIPNFSSSCSLLPEALIPRKSLCTLRTAACKCVLAPGSWRGGPLCWFTSAGQVERSRSRPGRAGGSHLGKRS